MNKNDTIVILGASNNPMRPSYMANKILKTRGYHTLGVGMGQDAEMEMTTKMYIQNDKTIAIFLKPEKQKKYYNYIFSMKPTRIIFNPGTENQELISMAKKYKIDVLRGCTIALVLNGLL